MTSPSPQPAILTLEAAKFIQHRVSINLACSDTNKRPALTRAYGCRVTDEQRVILYICSKPNQTVIDNIQSTRTLAVVFSRPSSNETIQLKGSDARLVSITPADLKAVQAYCASFKLELGEVDMPASFLDAMIPPLETIDCAIQFTPLAMYSQTPGPQAGKKISP